MFKIDLSGPVLDLAGAPIVGADGKELVLKDLAANVMASHTKNAVKFMGWALKMFKDGSILVDDADKKVIYEFIEGAEGGMTNLVKYQILKAIDEAVKA